MPSSLRIRASITLIAVPLLHIFTATAGDSLVFINAWWVLSNESEAAQSGCLCPQTGSGHVARKRESNATANKPGDERKREDEGHYCYLSIWRGAVHSLQDHLQFGCLWCFIYWWHPIWIHLLIPFEFIVLIFHISYFIISCRYMRVFLI